MQLRQGDVSEEAMAVEAGSSTPAWSARSIETVLASSNHRPSGFDYMRITLAVGVLLWHSLCVSVPTQAQIDAVWWSPLGYILRMILPMFFALSGFLVSSSLERNPDLRVFLTLRLIRIYPALCVEVLVSALIIGPIVTEYTLGAYFSGRYFYSYLLNSIGWVHFHLPGVFIHNPSTLAGIVNVSMWTVPYELECYIALSVLVIAGFLRSKWVAIAMFVAATALVFAYQQYSDMPTPGGGVVNGRLLMLCFLAGCLLFRLRGSIPHSGVAAALAFALGSISMRGEAMTVFAPLLVAYVTVYLGSQNPRKTIVVKSGDYSYGVYLYAAPIQQTVVWLLGDSNSWWANALIALPVVVGFALFSWHFVEKPFLKVKRFVLRKERGVRTSVPL